MLTAEPPACADRARVGRFVGTLEVPGELLVLLKVGWGERESASDWT
jgi:hypothetical protein